MDGARGDRQLLDRTRGSEDSEPGRLVRRRGPLAADEFHGRSGDTVLTDAHEITVGADLGYRFSPGAMRGFMLSAGAEYNLMQLVQLRAGYHYGELRGDDPSYASVGAGFRFLHLRLDFAYLFTAKHTPDIYSISFGFDF